MECPKCCFENPDGHKFCGECGYNLTPSSFLSSQELSIDEKIDKIQRYLPEGLTEKILSQRGKIEGERKQVTVMFCDMEGFTPMVEKLGSEKAYSVMDEVYEILIHKVHDFEGTVNEMTGDGIMALFGAPIALEDAPQRALRSALAVHTEIARFNGKKEGIDPIKIRIGVHTGPVVVGTLGNNLRVEFKAVGDTVNLASRMEGLAEPCSTYVTQDTFKLTEGLFQFESLGEKAVKGKETTVPVYKLLSALKDIHRPRLGLERSIYSEMVGREKELNRLELQVMKAINGEGSIVNIIGEAGIGKSRLIAELKNREVIKQVVLFEGRAISTGMNLSFHPINDLLKQWAGIGEDDSGPTALNKLETSIRRLDPEGLDEIFPFVATLMGVKLSGRYADRVKGIEGEALEKLIFKNMRDLIIKATEMKPHVIVMEDLHWADNSSVELLESLFRLAETQKIVFMNVFRPGYKETGDRIVENLKEKAEVYHMEINLQPLDERMSETLINNMLHIKGLKHAIIDQIVERADGNPFFIEEVVRSFIDHGAVVQKDGAFEVTEEIDKMVVPHTINDVLMARIDRLEEKTRDLLKVASVIGRSFFYRILSEVSRTIDDIDSKLSYLKEIELIRERKRMDELEYLFKHALAQEAAYASILHQTRKDLHIKVANSIESVFKEKLHEFYGMLAYHYSKGEDLDKAEEYMIKAGEEALGSAASSEALRYYQEALSLYIKKYGENADPDKLAMIEKNIAIALYNKGEFEEALVYLDKVLKRWGIKPPQNNFFIITKLLFDLFSFVICLYFPSKKKRKIPSHKDHEIFDLSYKKDTVLISLNPMRMFTEGIWAAKRILKFDFRRIENWYWTLICTSNEFAALGLFKLGKKVLNFSEGYVDKNNIRELFPLECFRFGYNSMSGKWNDIRDLDDSLLDENLKLGVLFNVTWYSGMNALVKIMQGQFSSIEPYLRKLAKIDKEYEYRVAQRYEFLGEISFFLYSRRLNDVREPLEKMDRLFKNESDNFQMNFFGLYAQIQILMNDYEGAEKSLRLAKDIYSKQSAVLPPFAINYLYPRFNLDLKLLEVSINTNNELDVLIYSKKLGKSIKQLLRSINKTPFCRTESFREMGTYHWLIGKQNKAVKFWKKATENGERLDARPDLARTYMEIGKRFLEEKSRYKELNGISAEGYLEKARELFQEMDLQWDLDELDKITSSV